MTNLDSFKKAYEAVHAAQPAEPVTQGEWVRVPKEPTDTMIHAGYKTFPQAWADCHIPTMWTAMIAAAPAEPATQGGEPVGSVRKRVDLTTGMSKTSPELFAAHKNLPPRTLLYTRPAPAAVPMTKERIYQVARKCGFRLYALQDGDFDQLKDFARAIEAHHGIGAKEQS